MADGPLAELMRPPRNPARAPQGLEQLIADATVNPLWELAQGVGAAASGYGNSPEAGAGMMAGIGIMSPMQRLMRPIRAYHGSPYDFDKFDMSKIGTGEGAQTYGRGLYFAEKEATAKSYRDSLANPQLLEPHTRAAEALKSYGSRDEAIKNLTQIFKLSDPHPQTDALREAIKILERGETPKPKQIGSMYEVDIHAKPEQFLDWDKPLGGQSESMKSAMDKLSGDQKVLLNVLRKQGKITDKSAGKDFITALGITGDEAASKSLRDAGIPGIKYLDQLSRPGPGGMTSAGMKLNVPPKTSNYVLFDDSIIEIMRKYGLAGATAGPLGALMMGEGYQDQ